MPQHCLGTACSDEPLTCRCACPACVAEVAYARADAASERLYSEADEYAEQIGKRIADAMKPRNERCGDRSIDVLRSDVATFIASVKTWWAAERICEDADRARIREEESHV